MWCVDPDQQPNTHTLLFTLPSSVENRGKVKILVYRISDTLIGKVAAIPSKIRNSVHYFPLVGRCPVTFWKAEPQHKSCLLRKTNAITTNDPFLPAFPEIFLLSTIAYSIEYPLGQFGSAAHAVSPPSPLPATPQPTGLLFNVWGGWRERLDAVQVLFSCSQNTGA